jgi:hypothetical protein
MQTARIAATAIRSRSGLEDRESLDSRSLVIVFSILFGECEEYLDRK